MENLPITCPKYGHQFKKSAPTGHHRPYSCPCGQVILSSTVLDYIAPYQDRDRRRAKVVLEMITEAWDDNNMAPFINTLEFERRLANTRRRPSWWKRLFGIR